MKKPKHLKYGDIVGLINPAGMLPERFKNQLAYTKQYLENIGFVVRDFIVYADWKDPVRRAGAFVDAFTDESVSAIFPICGGELIYEMISHIDFSEFAKYPPKIICGSSELSALVVSVSEFGDVVSFFGPHLNFLNGKSSKRENHFSVESFWNMLMWKRQGKKSLNRHEAYNFFTAPRDDRNTTILRNIYFSSERIREKKYKDNFYITLLEDSSITGTLLISSIDSLLKLVSLGEGKVDFSGKILILDSLDQSFDSVFSSLVRLSSETNVQDAHGIVFSCVSERTDRIKKNFPEFSNQKEIFLFLKKCSALFKDNIPFLYGLPIGHCAYKLTVPMGISATIETSSGVIILNESPFSNLEKK